MWSLNTVTSVLELRKSRSSSQWMEDQKLIIVVFYIKVVYSNYMYIHNVGQPQLCMHTGDALGTYKIDLKNYDILFTKRSTHLKRWKEKQSKWIIWRYRNWKWYGHPFYTLNRLIKPLDLFYKWNEECKYMQIKSWTETICGNLREVHEIIMVFCFSYTVTKTACKLRDVFERAQSSQWRCTDRTMDRIWEWGEELNIRILTVSSSLEQLQ